MQPIAHTARSRRIVLAALLCLLTLPAPVLGQGQLRYAGATTLQHHYLPTAAKAFKSRTGVELNYTGGNTGPGLRALLRGQVDLAGAGRYLRPAEQALGLQQVLIGWDALAVVVHQHNPVDSLSLAQLRGIFSGTIDNWQAVGGPAAPILVVTPPPGSGIRSALKELVLGDRPVTPREVVVPVVADGDLLVSQFPTAITVVSFSMYDAPGTRELAVDGVPLQTDAIVARRYPLVKPLLLVTRGAPTGTAEAFINFSLSQEGQALLARKFFPVAALSESGSEPDLR